MRNGALTLHCGFRAKDRCSRLGLAMCNSMASLHICHQHVCPPQEPSSCASCTLLPTAVTPADGWLRRSRLLGRPRVSAAAGGRCFCKTAHAAVALALHSVRRSVHAGNV